MSNFDPLIHSVEAEEFLSPLIEINDTDLNKQREKIESESSNMEQMASDKGKILLLPFKNLPILNGYGDPYEMEILTILAFEEALVIKHAFMGSCDAFSGDRDITYENLAYQTTSLRFHEFNWKAYETSSTKIAKLDDRKKKTLVLRFFRSLLSIEVMFMNELCEFIRLSPLFAEMSMVDIRKTIFENVRWQFIQLINNLESSEVSSQTITDLHLKEAYKRYLDEPCKRLGTRMKEICQNWRKLFDDPKGIHNYFRNYRCNPTSYGKAIMNAVSYKKVQIQFEQNSEQLDPIDFTAKEHEIFFDKTSANQWWPIAIRVYNKLVALLNSQPKNPVPDVYFPPVAARNSEEVLSWTDIPKQYSKHKKDSFFVMRLIHPFAEMLKVWDDNSSEFFITPNKKKVEIPTKENINQVLDPEDDVEEVPAIIEDPKKKPMKLENAYCIVEYITKSSSSDGRWKYLIFYDSFYDAKDTIYEIADIPLELNTKDEVIKALAKEDKSMINGKPPVNDGAVWYKVEKIVHLQKKSHANTEPPINSRSRIALNQRSTTVDRKIVYNELTIKNCRVDIAKIIASDTNNELASMTENDLKSIKELKQYGFNLKASLTNAHMKPVYENDEKMASNAEVIGRKNADGSLNSKFDISQNILRKFGQRTTKKRMGTWEMAVKCLLDVFKVQYRPEDTEKDFRKKILLVLGTKNPKAFYENGY